MIRFRNYDPARDREAAYRIWREVGWLERKKEQKKAARLAIECSHARVAEIDGAVESLVIITPAVMRYLDCDLPFSAVTGVTTGRVARKRGLAGKLTAQAIAEDAANGALVAGLGIFEQGYYDRLGFGVGRYEHWASFDPARLKSDVKPRIPRRITAKDWEVMHAARINRRRGHGSCNLLPPEFTQAEMTWPNQAFGLGYQDGSNGEMTHSFWCRVKESEHGPYRIEWMSFQTPEQFLELMALIHNLGDQVRLVEMREPPGIQIQDLIEQPLKQRQVSEGAKFESRTHAVAYWQMRMCDLFGCLERSHLRGDEVRFNLSLSDPIERFLDESAPWRGVAGEYTITLGPASGAEMGTHGSLPTLTASVGAFTRLWLGVLPATGLAMTDDLAGPAELLNKLDWALRLPAPRPDWDF